MSRGDGAGTGIPYVRKRRGRYLVQVAVPKDLQPVLGKKVLEKYLGTSEPYQARRRANPEVAKLLGIIERARLGREMSEHEIAAAARDYGREVYDNRRVKSADHYLEEFEDGGELAFAHHAVFDGQEIETKTSLLRRAESIAAEHGQRVSPELLEDLCSTLLDEGLRHARARQEGREPLPPLRKKPDGTPTLRAVLGEWSEKKDAAPRTLQEWERTVRLFEELHGSVSVGNIDRDMIREFRDALLRCPARPPHDVRKLPLPELAKVARPGDKLVSATAVNKTLGAIKSLLGFAAHVNQGYIDANPATGIRAEEPKRREDEERRSFTPDELGKVLAAASTQERAADRWLPLLAAYTGARRNELANLTVDDVQTENGIAYIRITDAGGRRVKTKGSRRRVPLHPVLIERGFLEYVEEQEGRLFPGLKPAAYTKRFGRMLDDIGITDRAVVFHSFRHSFKEACRAAGVSEEVHDALTGHAPQSVGRTYGAVPLATLAEAVGKITY